MSDIRDDEFDWDDNDDFEPFESQSQNQGGTSQQRSTQQVRNPAQGNQGGSQNQGGTQSGTSQAQGGTSQQRPQQRRPQQRRSAVPNPNQQAPRVQRNNPQQGTQAQGQRRNPQGGISQPQSQQQQVQQPVQQVQQPNLQQDIVNQEFNEFQSGDVQPNNPRKKSKLGIILAVVVIAIIGVVALKFFKGEPLVALNGDYDSSGKYAYDTLLSNLNNYSAENLDAFVGTENGDSYLAQEFAYVNGVALREEFITKMSSLVKFTYPQVSQLSTSGVEMKDESGNVIKIESLMNDGEAVTVTIPDYTKIAEGMDADKDYILNMYSTAGYKPEDYTYNDELTNLMCQYVCDLSEVPTVEVEVTMPIGTGTDGKPNISDDSALDDVLFGSVELRNMCAKFSQICEGYTGFKDEEYETEEEQDNPEWEKWNKLFQKYYKEDNGIFNENTSKWEPWYLRDDEDNFILDENGEKIVNYYSVKDKKGKDWIEPDKQIMVRVTKVRQVEDPWVEETGITYNWIGTHYLETAYDGKASTAFRVGDGSIEHPAGIGTTIITKVLCTDGNYHDVRVALMGYWTDQNAIDYAQTFSTKNKGFTTKSVIRLISYEVEIENLENVPITFETTEMTLCDENSNITARTGTLYGYTETTTLQPKEKTFINDWGASTELEQKYVCWGKSFGRTYPMVYFNILAGTGEIPPYSAYELFKGNSAIEDKVIGTETTESSESNGVETETSETSESTSSN